MFKKIARTGLLAALAPFIAVGVVLALLKESIVAGGAVAEALVDKLSDEG